MTDPYTIQIPPGCEDEELTYASIVCRLEPIAGTPFSKLVPLDPQPSAAHYEGSTKEK